MADIFISYSKERPTPTKALAADLEARGYTTWWDTSLLPGDKYGKLIEHEIDQAKVVIVIWTAESVSSDWFAPKPSAVIREINSSRSTCPASISIAFPCHITCCIACR
jgi:hypothetical protein